MKFFHLSDLHIGKIVNGFSMLEEQAHAFGQIAEYINTERPDAIVIAGDVYDRTIPGVEAVRLFDNFLTELADLDVAVMIISGNHDSPERLSYASRLLTNRRIFMRGLFKESLKKIIFSDRYGEVNFWLLPFIKPSYLYRADRERVNEIESYSDALAFVIESAGVDYSARNVLVSHQFFMKQGVESLRSESEMNPIGGLDAIDCSIIEKFDYAALGHLHGAQKVGHEHIRYAGSPVKYSFSEWRHQKSITMVELNEKGSVEVSLLPIKPLHDMREIRGKLEQLTSDEFLSSDKIRDVSDYMRVILTDEEEIVDPIGKIRSVYPNVMALEIENSRSAIDIAAVRLNTEQAEQLSVYDLFGEFFLDINGSVMSEEQADIVREVLDTDTGIV